MIVVRRTWEQKEQGISGADPEFVSRGGRNIYT